MRLSVNKLAKAYGLVWALKDVDFDFPPGSLVALLGPNGAGKTTLLRLLAGLDSATAGQIYFDGRPLARRDSRWRAGVGLLTPAEHLYDNLSVEENLRFFCSLYDRAGAAGEIGAALESVGLAERRGELVLNLSSGMKCRLSIVKWRLLRPELLLLDEPYGVLDGHGVDLLERFLRDSCAAGHVVIMASHHVPRALNLCNRALILRQGRLSFDEAKRQPWPSFVQAFGDFLPQGESWNS